MQLTDGALVAYAGLGGEDCPEVGDRGRVLFAQATVSHVRWLNGDVVSMVPNHDLVLVARERSEIAEQLDDSLDSAMSYEARALYDNQGVGGVLALLEDAGHTGVLTSIVEDAITTVGIRLRHEPAVAEIISQLDHDGGSAVVSALAITLLREILEH